MVRWVKCVLAILVVVMWILGVIILSLATAIRDNLSHIAMVTENTVVGNFYLGIFFPIIFPVLITVSCFIFVIGCLGWCGAFTESQILLGWFFFSILVTFCVELSAGIWRMFDYDLRFNGTTDLLQLKANIDRYAEKSSSVAWFENSWKEVHFNCCGVYSYADWLNSDPSILRSCCFECDSVDFHPEECVRRLVGKPGCGEVLLQFLSSSKCMDIVPYTTALMGIVQVAAMILTLKLWLAFCFSARNHAVNDSETTELPLTYVLDGYYLSSVKSKTHNKQRYSNTNRAMTSRSYKSHDHNNRKNEGRLQVDFDQTTRDRLSPPQQDQARHQTTSLSMRNDACTVEPPMANGSVRTRLQHRENFGDKGRISESPNCLNKFEECDNENLRLDASGCTAHARHYGCCGNAREYESVSCSIHSNERGFAESRMLENNKHSQGKTNKTWIGLNSEETETLLKHKNISLSVDKATTLVKESSFDSKAKPGSNEMASYPAIHYNTPRSSAITDDPEAGAT